MMMKKCVLLGAFLLSFTGVAMAQSVTVDVPSGYKVVVVPDSVSVPQAVSVASVASVPQTVYVAPTPAPAYRAHPYVRHLASVGEGMVIEHQIDDHHH
ncbi:hypothetical protein [Escherichia marmotae]|uniref:Uncharacterized protein n=2 Tax=Escherichia marmotae TaxID=1499973 RepID=A0ABU1C0R9_9ESCH|nr:hypothetical protein [Escherichia marmotae]MBE1766792.1 hypothetical protein [Escherichia marmotae]MCE5355155.1 hypothetical protein [Escherichia marmotae]MCE5384340.1 hypothetical protein [Escherichia marmotae]MDQ9211831.1 hypothetical protein [Escherichia marmotae]MDQ9227692.1 hypothetical protein [Escherichia marmotae]